MLYLTNKEPAEEVVSDVFTNVWLSRKNLQHIGNPEVYLFVAVKNRSLNYLKQFSRHHMVSLGAGDAEMLLSALCPEKETEQRELREKMNEAIASLPRQCQLVFRLIKEDGMKYKQAAVILQISPRTVQTHLFRAIEKLRESLQPYVNQRHGGVPFNWSAVPAELLLLTLLFFY